MKISMMSDIHTEFMGDCGRKFVGSLDENACDVLVLAGDISAGPDLPETLRNFVLKFEKIVYVCGNHEHYRMKREDLKSILVDTQYFAMMRNREFHWLENGFCEIDGQRFVGATMWFPNDIGNIKFESNLSDFLVIPDFKRWVYDTNALSCRFLKENIQENDVVITHHAPSNKSIDPKYQGSDLNRFYVTDVEHIALENRPKLWIHGHMHDSKDYLLGDCRVVCNPHGYFGTNDINPNFNQHVIEI